MVYKPVDGLSELELELPEASICVSSLCSNIFTQLFPILNSRTVEPKYQI